MTHALQSSSWKWYNIPSCNSFLFMIISNTHMVGADLQRANVGDVM
jgi:hypothetical protein